MSHTPGPWELDKSASPWQISGIHPDPEVGKHLIAETGEWLSYNSENDEANSNLIAAAPELLAACEFAVVRIAMLIPFDAHIEDELVARAVCKAGDEAQADIEIIQQAIAKAKGE